MTERPSDNTDEFRARQELDKQREVHRQRQSELVEQERNRLKTLHWMRCPKCGDELAEIEFRGVKVDKCLSCGGVYLDDGELEQLAGKPGWFEAMFNFFRG